MRNLELLSTFAAGFPAALRPVHPPIRLVARAGLLQEAASSCRAGAGEVLSGAGEHALPTAGRHPQKPGVAPPQPDEAREEIRRALLILST